VSLSCSLDQFIHSCCHAALYSPFIKHFMSLSLSSYSGMIAFVFAFLLYCTLQLRDGTLIRPHPAVWRFVQGVSILYMCLLAFILFQPVQNVRRWFFYFYPDLHGQPLEERAYAEHCDLYTPNDPESSFRNIRVCPQLCLTTLLGIGHWTGKKSLKRNGNDVHGIWFVRSLRMCFSIGS
jgi:hypothetical protein